MIELKHVQFAYGDSGAGLRDVSLTVRDGEFCFVTGPSGSGKSTLSKIITAELFADVGTVQVNNYTLSENLRSRELAEARRTIGVVYQDFRLITSMTVRENLEFAMRCVNARNEDIEQRIPEVLELVALSGKENRMPSELSGGEQQRVAIARAIINRPLLVIADEPTGNLDPRLAADIFGLFMKINEAGTTTLIITHAYDLVQKYHKRVIAMRDGRITGDSTVRKVVKAQ